MAQYPSQFRAEPYAAQSGGLAYTFESKKRPILVPQGKEPVTTTPFDTPAPPDAEIANVDNLTGNYYNAYSKVKDFTTTMWQDYGLDVTKPDLTQPGGGQFYQAYLNMDANLRMTAQDLKVQRKRMDEAFTSAMKGESYTTIDPTKQLFTESQEPVVSTNINPEVENAMKLAATVYGTQAEADAAWETQIFPLKQKLLQQQAINPENAEFFQRQIDALVKPTWEKQQFAPQRPGGGGGGTKKDTKFETQLHVERQGGKPGQVGAVQTSKGWETVMIIPKDESAEEDYGRINIKDKEGNTTEVAKRVAFRYQKEDGSIYERYQYPLDDPQYDLRVDTNTIDQNLDDYYTNNPNRDSWSTWSADEKRKKKKQNLTEAELGLSAAEIQQMREQKLQNSEVLKQNKKLITDEKSRLETMFTKDAGPFTLQTNVGPLTFKRQWWDSSLLKLDDESIDLLNQQNVSVTKKDNLKFEEVNKLLTNTGYYVLFSQPKNP